MRISLGAKNFSSPYSTANPTKTEALTTTSTISNRIITWSRRTYGVYRYRRLTTLGHLENFHVWEKLRRFWRRDMNHANLVKAIMSIHAWELAEAATKGLLKVGHQRSYQGQMKAKLASTHLARFVSHIIAPTRCKINEAS